MSSIFYIFKGVVLTHQNLVATMKCLMFMLEPMPDEAYIAYLPLAHVLELLSENTMLLFGIKVNVTDFLMLKYIFILCNVYHTHLILCALELF